MPAAVQIARLDARRDDFRAALSALRERLSPRGNLVSEAGRQKTLAVFGEALTPAQVVERICHDVASKGLAAVLDYSARIDNAPLTGDALRVPESELVAAHRKAAADFLTTIERVRSNILKFQWAVLHQDTVVERSAGVLLRQRYLPLNRVGICVPGGAAAYPSTVLMTAVPAQAAGVQELAVIAPPTPLGAYNADLLATCHALGIREVYRLGGAQGVAALAYGIQGLPKVDKIVGPGNMFVALAKKFAYGEGDIDSIAGPSEVVIVADSSARADFLAADLIAQAEHSPAASVLISWDEELLDRTRQALSAQLARLPRGELARRSLEEFGAMILVGNEDEAARVANEIAAEHLHLQTSDPAGLLSKIRCAGAAFLGHHTPVALGDYVAGPSHVLPTGGTARFASGLCANDFLRRTSVIEYTPQALAADAQDVKNLAEREGLTAHWASVEIRLGEQGGETPKTK